MICPVQHAYLGLMMVCPYVALKETSQWSQVQAPMRAEDVFRECYHMGKVRHKSGRHWEQLLARGSRRTSAIHMEVRQVTSQSMRTAVMCTLWF